MTADQAREISTRPPLEPFLDRVLNGVSCVATDGRRHVEFLLKESGEQMVAREAFPHLERLGYGVQLLPTVGHPEYKTLTVCW